MKIENKDNFIFVNGKTIEINSWLEEHHIPIDSEDAEFIRNECESVAEILALDQDDFDECKLKDDIWAAVMATRGELVESDLSGEKSSSCLNIPCSRASFFFSFFLFLNYPSTYPPHPNSIIPWCACA
jgi:hypothetical protein